MSSSGPRGPADHGAAVATLGLALCLLGGAFGMQALYVPGVGLVALALLAEGTVRMATWRGSVELEPRRAHIEEREALQVSVSVRGWRVPFGGRELHLRGVSAAARWHEGRAEFALRARRRGAIVVGPAVARYSDPFTICARELSSPAVELLVLPRIEHLRGAEIVRVAGAERPDGAPARQIAAADVDGLRPYRRGTPASRIHWPTVARTGTLQERRLLEETDGVPVVALDSLQPASVEALDMAVRAAASLCLAFAKAGGCLLWLPGAQRPQLVRADLGSWPKVHAQLALVEPGGTPSLSAIGRAATVLWVSARPPGPVTAGRDGSRYTVSPLPAHAKPVLFAVAGCSVQPAARTAIVRTPA